MATTITTFKKARAGVEDLHFDTDGASATAITPTSAGGSRLVRKLNASHIPITTTTRAKTDAAGVTLTETNVDTALQQLFTDNAAQGIPDNSTLEVSSGVLRVKSGGIAASHIATGAVGSDELASASVIQAKIGNDAVGASQLQDDASVDANRAVTTNHIRDSAVTQAKIADGAVINSKITDATIKAAKLYNVPTHYIYYAGSVSSTDTAASSTFSLGMADNFAGTELIQATMVTAGTSVTYIKTVVLTAGTKDVEVTFGTPMSAGTTTIHFVVLKPVTA